MDDATHGIGQYDFLALGGEMGGRISGFDWSSTPLGPIERWPQALRTTVQLMTASRFPKFLLWGEERTLLYNDACRPMLGVQHPDALGRRFFDLMGHLRDAIGPIIDQAFAGVPSYVEDTAFVLMRGGQPEETWFTFSYGPVRDERGRVAGALCTCIETTRTVVAEALQAFRVELEGRLRDLNEPQAIISAAQEALGRRLGVNRVGYGDVDGTARYFTTEANWTDGGVPHSNGTHDLAAFGPEVLAALRRGDPLVIHDVAEDPRTNSPEALAAFAHLQTASVLTATLVKDGRMTAALYAHQRTPRRWTEADLGLLLETAERTWSALERARAEARSEARARQLEALNEAAMAIAATAGVEGKLATLSAAVRSVLRARDVRARLIADPSPPPCSGRPGERLSAPLLDGRGEALGMVEVCGREDGRDFEPSDAAVLAQLARLAGASIEQAQAVATVRRANQSLEERVEQRTLEFERIWRLSRDAFVVLDQEGVWRRVSPAWTELLGWTEAELTGRTPDWIRHPEDLAATRAEYARLVAGDPIRRFENRFRHKDGSYRWIAWSAVGSDGLFYAVARDVTAEKEAADSLCRTEEALRQAQKMEAIGQLTGGIAHDFNNMLTGIIGGLDMLRHRLKVGRTDDLARFIDAAATSAHRAAALTHRLLAFSRRQSLDLRPVEIGRLIASMAELVTRTLRENIELELAADPDLWDAQSDANQLESAILNLAINARDALPSGGRVTLGAANVSREDSQRLAPEGLVAGEYVKLFVRDTGVGMEPGVLARAFDPFFTTKPIGQGTGLGLSMVYGFVTQAGGHVRIDSAPGRGTTVELYLPRASRPAEAGPDADAHAAALPTGSGEVVLVVEDDPAVRQLVCAVLGELGYAAVEAEDGRAALPILQSSQRIDLMVSDVGLPGLNGRQLAELARQKRPQLKILFVTGYAEHAADRGEFLAPGMEMITKPFALDALAGKIRQMIAAG